MRVLDDLQECGHWTVIGLQQDVVLTHPHLVLDEHWLAAKIGSYVPHNPQLVSPSRETWRAAHTGSAHRRAMTRRV